MPIVWCIAIRRTNGVWWLTNFWLRQENGCSTELPVLMCGKGNLKYITFVSVILHENSHSQLKSRSIQPYPECSKKVVRLITECLKVGLHHSISMHKIKELYSRWRNSDFSSLLAIQDVTTTLKFWTSKACDVINHSEAMTSHDCFRCSKF